MDWCRIDDPDWLPREEGRGEMDSDFRSEDQDMIDFVLNGVQPEATFPAPLASHDHGVGPTSPCISSSVASAMSSISPTSSLLPLQQQQQQGPAPPSHVGTSPTARQHDMASWSNSTAAAAAAPPIMMMPWPRPLQAAHPGSHTQLWSGLLPGAAAQQQQQQQQQQRQQYQPHGVMMPQGTAPSAPAQQASDAQHPAALIPAWRPAAATAASAASLGCHLPLLEPQDFNNALDQLHNPSMQPGAANLFGASTSTTSASANMWRTSLPPAVDRSTAWPPAFSVPPAHPLSAPDATCPAKLWKWDMALPPAASCPNLDSGFKDFITTRDVRISSATPSVSVVPPASDLFFSQRDAGASAFRPLHAIQGRKRSCDFLSEAEAGQSGRELGGQDGQAPLALHPADMAAAGAGALMLPLKGMMPAQPAANQLPPGVGPSPSTLAGPLFPASGQRGGGALLAPVGQQGNQVQTSLVSRQGGQAPLSERQQLGLTTAGQLLGQPTPTALLRPQSGQTQSLGQLIPKLALQASLRAAAAAATAGQQQQASPRPAPAASGGRSLERWMPTNTVELSLEPRGSEVGHAGPASELLARSPGAAQPFGWWVPTDASTEHSFDRRAAPAAVVKPSSSERLPSPTATATGQLAGWTDRRQSLDGRLTGAGGQQQPAVVPPVPPLAAAGVMAGPEWMTFFSQCSASLTAAAAALQLAGDDSQILVTASPTSCSAMGDLAAFDAGLEALRNDVVEQEADKQAGNDTPMVAAAAVAVTARAPRGDGSTSGLSRAAASRREALLPSLEAVRQVFDLPLKEAASRLGMSVSHMKNTCRRLGIRAWPHRKLGSLQSLREAVLDLSDDERAEVLGQIDRTSAAVMADPDFAVPPELDTRRKAVYKHRHAICKQQHMEPEQPSDEMS